jgi:hypothetical protein
MLVKSEIKIIESPVRDDMYFYRITMVELVESEKEFEIIEYSVSN